MISIKRKAEGSNVYLNLECLHDVVPQGTRQILGAIAACRRNGQLAAAEANLVAVERIELRLVNAPTMEQDGAATGPEGFRRKAMGEFRAPLQLLGHLRYVDTAALELNRNREENVSGSTYEEKNIVTSFTFHFVSRERPVCVYHDSTGWHILHGHPASVSSARIAEVFCAYL